MPKIVIVDENDRVVGTAERSEARARGLYHRISRIFLINSNGEVLLQRRSMQVEDKPGKWDQSAGGHVDEGEDYIDAAARETFEELGAKVDDLVAIGKFYSEREIANQVTICRFNTVFMTYYDGAIQFDPGEVLGTAWYSVTEVDDWLAKKPEDFTDNFPKTFNYLKTYLTNKS